MPTIRVPSLFKYYLEGQSEVHLPGKTVAESLHALADGFPKIQPHLYDSSGQIRRHINLFVNADNIRDLNGLETAVGEEDVIKVLPSVTGGKY
jgi:molybdopterin converting factor small subunit